MSTYGTQKVFGGTRYKRYFNPKVKNTANEFGLYSWSAFSACIVSVDEESGLIVPEPNPNNALTLFVSDLPALLRLALVSDTGAVSYQYSQNVLASALRAESGGSLGTTLSAYGQVASGYTGVGDAVFCTGFPVTFAGFDQTTPASQCFLEVIANSPVVASPLAGGSLPTPAIGLNSLPVGVGITPIILNSSNYTDTIKANDNIIINTITTVDGPVDVAFVVVGLWHPASKGGGVIEIPAKPV